jgi:ABC-type phosphate/phosphonate transport system permease subunit
MYHKAYDRQKPSKRERAFDRNGRWGIPKDAGSARFLESMMLLSTMAVLAVALGLAVGVPLALMLSDFCSRTVC